MFGTSDIESFRRLAYALFFGGDFTRDITLFLFILRTPLRFS